MDERLVVGGGRDGRESTDGTLHPFVEVAAYDPATQTWSPRSAAPSDDGNDPPSALYTYARGSSGGDQASLVADPLDGPNDARQRFYGPDGEWEQAPLPSAQRLAGYWVATSPSRGDPGDTPFSLQVRLVGGRQGADLEPATEAWVFDLAG